MSGSLGPLRIFRASGFGLRWWWQDSEYVRLGKDSSIAVMFGDACMYLVFTPLNGMAAHECTAYYAGKTTV